jgi:hypothetical protein
MHSMPWRSGSQNHQVSVYQLLGASCIMYHAPCVIDSHVTIATDGAYSFGLSFERFSTSQLQDLITNFANRPCVLVASVSSRPRLRPRFSGHMPMSGRQRNFLCTLSRDDPVALRGVLCYNEDRALERTPSHQKRGGSRLSKGDNRENPLSGRLASRNTKGNQKEGREGYLRSCDDHRWWRRGAFLDAKRIRNHAIQRKIKR